MALNESCFMVTWSIQKPLLGGEPNTKPGYLALQNLTIIDLLYFIMCENPT